MGAALRLARLRRADDPGRAEERRALRDGDDREAGRLRRPREHDERACRSTAAAPGAEYEITGHKWFCSAPMCDAFLVLAQTEAGISCFLMPRWTPDGERNALPHPAPQGQARQPLQRLERGRVPRRLGPPRRRGGRAACGRSSRWSTTPASTAPPVDGRDAHRRRPGDQPRDPPLRLRQAPDRPAADAERARRPRGRVRGRDRVGAAPRAGLRRGDRRRRGRPGAAAPRQPRPQVLDLQARPVRTPSRASSASAATATSRSRACPASSARARCHRSGRAPATSSASTCSARRWPQPGVGRSLLRRGRGGARVRCPPRRLRRRDSRGDVDRRDDLEPRARRVVERMALALQGSLLVRYGDQAVADAFCASPPRRRLGQRLRHPARRRPIRSGSSSGTRRGYSRTVQGREASAGGSCHGEEPVPCATGIARAQNLLRATRRRGDPAGRRTPARLLSAGGRVTAGVRRGRLSGGWREDRWTGRRR